MVFTASLGDDRIVLAGPCREGRTSWVSLTEEMGCQLADPLICASLPPSTHASAR